MTAKKKNPIIALAVVSAVFVAHRTAQAAADLAALAAAETLRTGGDACQVAEEVAVERKVAEVVLLLLP